MRTSNPALSDKTFRTFIKTDSQMTIQGTVNKSLFLILLTMFAGYMSWQSAYPGGWSPEAVPTIPPWYLPVILGAFGLSLVIIFKKTTAPFLTPLYALLEGAALGALSSIFEARYPGIVMQAVLCTFGTFISLLLAYKSGLIKATENFKLGVTAATGGIALVYLIDLGLMFFGMRVPFIHENGPIGIAVSVGITIVAALNLVLDFDFIEDGAKSGAPKYMEWYASFGLLVTLIWLYLEFLRLLAKSRKK
ncbi:MAG: Bax inhibitor-1/YccA family protein [Bdellovibrionaceae bacterium]|nr:Bax inhibitor-1/YccA family protein [Pseudobdellovibrionaceae bacterium]